MDNVSQAKVSRYETAHVNVNRLFDSSQLKNMESMKKLSNLNSVLILSCIQLSETSIKETGTTLNWRRIKGIVNECKSLHIVKDIQMYSLTSFHLKWKEMERLLGGLNSLHF